MTDTLRRYVLFQVPGWVLFGAAMVLAHRWEWLPGWGALALFGAWVLKDALMYPFFGFAYATERRSATERLIGMRGVVVQTLSPCGYVQVRGELWQAETAAGPIGEGDPVVVSGVRGMMLVVRAEESAGPSRVR